MTTDRVLTIFSIIIGLPSFVALFISSEHRQAGAAWLVVILLLVVARWFWKREQEKPQFSSLELRKNFKILTTDGTSATYSRLEKLRVNFNGINEWWNRNILQDGTVSNILIDGVVPDTLESSVGSTNVCKRFSRPLEKGEELTIEMTYELHNCFTRPHECVIHNNSAKVPLITIVIDLPRPCFRAELRMTYSGDHGKLLAPPEVSKSNRRIEAKIRKPRMGASYHVEWDW